MIALKLFSETPSNMKMTEQLAAYVGARTPHDVETAIARVRRDREEAQRVDLAAWPETRDLELLVARFAHSHSASQFLQHLPSH